MPWPPSSLRFVNIVGGLTIGVLQQGMTVAAAAQTYTLLTVGEGLVGARFRRSSCSTAAGIVITRAASEVNLGFEISRQVLISPKADRHRLRHPDHPGPGPWAFPMWRFWRWGA
jgi:type III secretory pathway component EscV